MFGFKLPRIMVYAGLIGATALILPPVIIARTRVLPTPNRPIHLIWDMDFQNKFKAQVPNPLFADGRSERPLVEGAVARGEAYTDAHMYDGVSGGQWATTVPQGLTLDMEFLQRGQARFNIYCTPCHGYAGQGDGSVNRRAMELVENAGGPVNGTTWVTAKNLHDDTVLVQPMGQIYNSITNGIRNMAGYASQIPTQDRWAIAAYVKALQLSQNSTMVLADAGAAPQAPPAPGTAAAPAAHPAGDSTPPRQAAAPGEGSH